MKDYYRILGISTTATDREIKEAYRKKAKLYHPDVCKLEDASSRFIEVTEAYEILSDTQARHCYDQQIKYESTSQQSHTYQYAAKAQEDFTKYQQRAYNTARQYANVSLEKVLSQVFKGIVKAGKFIAVGEKRKSLTAWEFIKLGLCGICIIISIIMLFTGVGTIPGGLILLYTYRCLFRHASYGGEFIGFVPLILSTLVVGIVIAIIFGLMIVSMFGGT